MIIENLFFIVGIIGWVMFLIISIYYTLLINKTNKLINEYERKLKLEIDAKEEARKDTFLLIKLANEREIQFKKTIEDLKKQHAEDSEKQARIADANIKRLNDTISNIKSERREKALQLAINQPSSLRLDVVDNACLYYNFLIGK